MRRPPITEKNQKLRKEWALEHANWIIAQWHQILGTDETWIIGGDIQELVLHVGLMKIGILLT
jgi:hypothetical protein